MADTEIAVQAALSKQGTMYVWGATGPDNFDCSGLVVWAFKEAGIDVSRTTYTQILEGEEITGSPQRGDLVFPDAGHVMIALGGNQAVHAPQAGEPVKISEYWQEPIAIRRLGTNTGSSTGATTADYQHTGILSDSLGAVTAPFETMGEVFGWLLDPDNWKRILLIVSGGVIVITGITVLTFTLSKDLMKSAPSLPKMPKVAKSVKGAPTP